MTSNRPVICSGNQSQSGNLFRYPESIRKSVPVPRVKPEICSGNQSQSRNLFRFRTKIWSIAACSRRLHMEPCNGVWMWIFPDILKVIFKGVKCLQIVVFYRKISSWRHLPAKHESDTRFIWWIVSYVVVRQWSLLLQSSDESEVFREICSKSFRNVVKILWASDEVAKAIYLYVNACAAACRDFVSNTCISS